MNDAKEIKPTEGNATLTGIDNNAIVTTLANEDKMPWYRKPNLRHLYIMLIPTCMGIQITSGFHGQMVNAIQILPSWITCEANLL